jgi:hypothetical protein
MRNIIALSTLALGAIVGFSITPPAAIAQISDPVCLMTESGAVHCSYQSIRQCLQSRTGPSDSCEINSTYGSEYEGTVGFGGVAPDALDRRPLRSEPEPYTTR